MINHMTTGQELVTSGQLHPPSGSPQMFAEPRCSLPQPAFLLWLPQSLLQDSIYCNSGGYSLLALSCPASAGSKDRSGRRWRISLEKGMPEVVMPLLCTSTTRWMKSLLTNCARARSRKLYLLPNITHLG